jgi:flagellar basal body-associated protein FliL
MTDGQKAGVGIAVLATVALIAAGTYFFMRWRKRALDKEFAELKEQHEANKSRPKSQPLPVYPRTDTTIVGGFGAYRDVFDKPGSGG